MKPIPSAPGQPVVALRMTDEDVVARAAALIGRGYSHCPSRKPGVWRDIYSTRASGGRAIEVMRRLEPLMGERRKTQIADALAAANLKPQYVKFTDTQVDEVIARHRAGEAVGDLAAEYGMAKTTVYSYINGYRRGRVVQR